MDNQLAMNECPLSVEDSQRYCRQLLLPQISLMQQNEILKAEILIIGAGGLGCPCVQYLLAAGFRHLTIVDNDQVDVSNLHRQVMHWEQNAGSNKVDSIKQSLLAMDGKAQVTSLKERFNQKNYRSIMEDDKGNTKYRVIIDCSDNPMCKYLTSDVSKMYSIPCIIGAALMWEGQLIVFDPLNPSNSNCYRCIHPVCPPQQGACNEAGVVGMAVGIIGQLQALECLKLVLDRHLYQTGWMLLFDGYQLAFRKAKMRKSQPDCIACQGTLQIDTYDYDHFINGQTVQTVCEVKLEEREKEKEMNKMYSDVTWEQFIRIQKEEKQLLVDVRPSNMYKIVNLVCSISIPLEKIMKGEREEIEEGRDVYVMCRRGVASREAAQQIGKTHKGGKVFNIQGGIEEYSRYYSHSMPFL